MLPISSIALGSQIIAGPLAREPKLEDFEFDPRNVRELKRLKLEADRLNSRIRPIATGEGRGVTESGTSRGLDEAIAKANAAVEKYRAFQQQLMKARTAAWEKAYDDWNTRQRALQRNEFGNWQRNLSVGKDDTRLGAPLVAGPEAAADLADEVTPAQPVGAPAWTAPEPDIPPGYITQQIGPEPKIEDFPLPDVTALQAAEKRHHIARQRLADIASKKVRANKSEVERIIAEAGQALDDYTRIQMRTQSARADAWGAAYKAWQDKAATVKGAFRNVAQPVDETAQVEATRTWETVVPGVSGPPEWAGEEAGGRIEPAVTENIPGVTGPLQPLSRRTVQPESTAGYLWRSPALAPVREYVGGLEKGGSIAGSTIGRSGKNILADIVTGGVKDYITGPAEIGADVYGAASKAMLPPPLQRPSTPEEIQGLPPETWFVDPVTGETQRTPGPVRPYMRPEPKPVSQNQYSNVSGLSDAGHIIGNVGDDLIADAVTRAVNEVVLDPSSGLGEASNTVGRVGKNVLADLITQAVKRYIVKPLAGRPKPVLFELPESQPWVSPFSGPETSERGLAY